MRFQLCGGLRLFLIWMILRSCLRQQLSRLDCEPPAFVKLFVFLVFLVGHGSSIEDDRVKRLTHHLLGVSSLSRSPKIVYDTILLLDGVLLGVAFFHLDRTVFLLFCQFLCPAQYIATLIFLDFFLVTSQNFFRNRPQQLFMLH